MSKTYFNYGTPQSLNVVNWKNKGISVDNEFANSNPVIVWLYASDCIWPQIWTKWLQVAPHDIQKLSCSFSLQIPCYKYYLLPEV